MSKDEALAKLAKKYFSSHCPATLQDFIWWFGLSVANARHALEMIKPGFISETIGSQTYWLSNSFSTPVTAGKSGYLLPAFDEFMISYKDRSAALNFENHKKSISGNGIFKPVIVINGHTTGVWKRIIKNDKVIIETEFFRPPSKTELNLIRKASEKYEHFLEKNSSMQTGT
ncbi:MAG: crosslink repair DNA glycosylase YcaQ family protein [Ginsengibacter sp.]